jgi:raffinose/stachyose/melibiose transport system substrate-binding protein
MKTKKKILAILSSTALFVSILAGCSSDSKQHENTVTEQTPEPVTLTLLMDNQSSARMEGIKAVTDVIEKKYNIKTEIETRPGGVEGDNLVKTRLATGDMTDLALYNSGSLLQALNPERSFVDLTNEPYMEKVSDEFKEAVTVNSKVYGIPFATFSAGGWFYNKKVYQELGLSVPKPWEELMANSEKIKAAGKTAVIGTYKDAWTSQVIVLADNYNVITQAPSFPDDFTANKAKMATTPAALRSFEKLEEVNKKGYMNKDFNAIGYEAGLEMLAEGMGVQYPMLSYVLSDFAKLHPDKINDIGFFPQPGDSAEKNGMTVWAPDAFYINKNSDHVDAAKKWAEFFVSPEAVRLYLSKVPPDGPAAVEDVKLPKDVYPAVKDMLPYFEEDKTAPALEFLSPLKGPNLQQITFEVGGGLKSAKEGAQLYDKDVETQAKQLGLAGW